MKILNTAILFGFLAMSNNVFAIGGMLKDTKLQEVTCENTTTGQIVTLQSEVKDKTAWDCGVAGLEVSAGDIVKETLIGIAQQPVQKSCKDIISINTNSKSGIYVVSPTGQSKLKVYCDMTTDGGGWTLALAYKHIGGQNNDLVLGIPLNPKTSYSHMANATMKKLAPYTEARFYCNTSAHSRVIDFKTNNVGVISYITNGKKNNPNYWTDGITLFTDNSANLPTAIQNVVSNQGNYAMTEFPFWLWSTYHWGIRGAGSRWECDDYDDGDGYSNTTLHQVWVR